MLQGKCAGGGNAFDAAVLIAFAIQKAGSVTDRVAIRDALREVSKPGGRPITPAEIGDGLIELRNGGDIDYKGASGNVDFDEGGNVTGGFIVESQVNVSTAWIAGASPCAMRAKRPPSHG